MTTKRPEPSSPFFGVIVLLVGLFFIAASLGIIPDDGIPARRTPIFDSPRHWQITSFGVAFASAGLSSLIPPRYGLLLRITSLLCLVCFLAGMIGTFLARR